MNLKPLIVAACVVFSHRVNAQTNVWQPSPGHAQFPIWPGTVPDAQPVPGPEYMIVKDDHLIAGRPWIAVCNVSQPTLTVYSPSGTNTGVAVIVFPGGGYKCLAIDLEGTEICDWLTSRGITAVLLKYRVPFSGSYWDEKSRKQIIPKAPMALEDAQRTMGLLRLHAAEWHINPRKIGVLGFSAGGHLVAAMSTQFEKRLYPPVDAADKESCRPDFAVSLYPGHMLENTSREFDLNPTLPVTGDTPPTFLLQAENDPVDNVQNSLVYYAALKKAGVPVEMHLYAEGGHAFGLRRTTFPITGWPQLMETWLKTIGMISE
jgi:acetyl esterase/lipase